VKAERKVADWECDQCGKTEQTEIPDDSSRCTFAELTGEDEKSNYMTLVAPLPVGWTHWMIYGASGTQTGMDLCHDCGERLLLVHQGKLRTVRVVGRKNAVPNKAVEPAKKVAKKKAAKKPKTRKVATTKVAASP
jgi:hypothetical protein